MEVISICLLCSVERFMRFLFFDKPPWVVQKTFAPKRYYSIDRVFRNEAVDRTHLAEFHQIEGNRSLVSCLCGVNLIDILYIS